MRNHPNRIYTVTREFISILRHHLHETLKLPHSKSSLASLVHGLVPRIVVKVSLHTSMLEYRIPHLSLGLTDRTFSSQRLIPR